MFRVSKFNVLSTKQVSHLTFRMSLAKRLIKSIQLQSWENSLGERTFALSASQSYVSGKQKKGQSTESEEPHASSMNTHRWPRKIFSGIQPTGALHLGNYLGAVRKWTDLQKKRENVTICIVDMHSITMPHNPPVLRENIFTMAATLLACGIDPALTTLFVQSSVSEHAELNWILNSLTTMPRLSQLPQFKEKSRTVRDVPLGLFVYPVLQAADIMLYKATHVPVGADQVQHIQLAQHLTRTFNSRYGDMFPVCTAMIEENDGSRILSLREPSKKMSKSELNPKGTINLSDAPDQIVEKVKKAITDFTSDISYDPNMRPGVSNLVNIHAQVTGQSIETIVEEANQLHTSQYKERVSEAIIEHLRPIREKMNVHLNNRNELMYMLEMGSDKARKTAQQTIVEVKQRLGLGVAGVIPPTVSVPQPLPDHSKLTASRRLAKGVFQSDAHSLGMTQFDQRLETSHGTAGGDAGQATTGEMIGYVSSSAMRAVRRPIVPVQRMRVEKTYRSPSRHVFKMDTFNMPKMGFQDGNVSAVSSRSDQRARRNPVIGFTPPSHLGVVNSSSGFRYGNSNPSALASLTSQINAANKQQEMASSLVNSAYYKAALNAHNDMSPSVVDVAVNTVLNRSNSANAASVSENNIDDNSNIDVVSSSSSSDTVENTSATKSATEEEDGESCLEDQEEDEETATTENIVEKTN